MDGLMSNEQSPDAPAYPDSVVLPHGGSAAIALAEGFVTASAGVDGVCIEFGEDAPSVLLQVTETVQLHDGDMISAGLQWLQFEAGQQGGPNRLHRLDSEGNATMTFTLRSSLSIGQCAGDVLIPGDARLSALHFQVLVRDGQVYLQDLSSEDGTYLLVRSGEVVPFESQLLVDDRPLLVRTPLPSLDQLDALQGLRPPDSIAA